jgi:hypothetical protein
MSGQRHLRIAALIIGALGALRLLWLALDVVRGAAPALWWLEGAFHGVLILVAIRLMKGSDLAWFAAVLIFGGAGIIGLEGVLDLALPPASANATAVVRTAGLLAAGAYGIWALLASPRVKAFRARHGFRERFSLAIATAAALAVICGIGWYLDSLSPDIQRTLAVQIGIAAAFITGIGFVAARNRKAPLRWEFLPLAVAVIAIVANLETMSQLRELRTLSRTLSEAAPDQAAAIAEALPGQAHSITAALQNARDGLLARMETQTAAVAPWPLTAVLESGAIADPVAVNRTAAALDGLATRTREALEAMDVLLVRFADQRRRIIEDLPEPARRRIALRFEQEESAYRSHYGARVNLLSRARLNLDAMMDVLPAQPDRYTADWSGAPVFQDADAARAYDENRAALDELRVWDARLRAEGAALAAGKPAWGWLAAID